MSKKFIDKSKAQHFQLVYRSQRDPLVVTESASQMVLKPLPLSKNALKKGHVNPTIMTTDYSEDLISSDIESNNQTIETDASLYGIYFDDQDEYNYLEHLKPIGKDPAAVFIPSQSKTIKQTPGDIKIIDTESKKPLNDQSKHVSFTLPSELFASSHQEEVGMMNRGIGESAMNLELDEDVRQVLYALEDDAYVEDDLTEEFFDVLDGDCIPESLQSILIPDTNPSNEHEDEWVKNYNEFKNQSNDQSKNQSRNLSNYQSSDESEDEQDELASLDGRFSRAATTNYSMSSSAMFRNKQLTLLDERFDQLLIQEYSDDDESDQDEISNTQVDEIFNEFLNSDLQGKRIETHIDGKDALSSIRLQLMDGPESRQRIHHIINIQNSEPEELYEMPEPKKRDNWDCESVLSTYSNIYNHPKIIQERNLVKRIELCSNGMPRGSLYQIRQDIRQNKTIPNDSDNEQVSQEDTQQDTQQGNQQEIVNLGIARSKQETLEEKKQRKLEIKLDKRVKREIKKSFKNAFKIEKNKQISCYENTKLQSKTIHIE